MFFRQFDCVVLGKLLGWAVAESEKESEIVIVLQQKKDLVESDFVDVLDSVERSHKLKAKFLERFQVQNGILAEDGGGDLRLRFVQKSIFEEQIDKVAEGE